MKNRDRRSSLLFLNKNQFIDIEMWCLISQPNSLVIEVKVDPKAIGQECLEKVCKHLGILNESDYFGLKYENKGEELWLNLRNPIDRQVNCHGTPNSLRLALRVKFWVPPHLLLQERTRHIFYQHAHVDLIENRLLASDWDCVARLIAFIAQAECGDYDELSHPPHNIYMQASSITPATTNVPKPHDLLQRIIAAHKKCKGMKQSTAEYWLLKEASELENFGEELFTTKGMVVGVGPQGLTVYRKNEPKQPIGYTSILSASSHRKTFKLEYLSGENNNKETVLEVKLDSNHLASSLYRALTEKHAFYSCETVRSAVTAQFIRDWKGTIVSIINEDSSLGKKYVFDIRRTCREVYDNARRALYQENGLQMAKVDKGGCTHDGISCKDSEEKLHRLLDAVTCKICMDNQINVVFLPCAHVVACTECAARVDRCPLCRSEFRQAQRLYFPSEFHEFS